MWLLQCKQMELFLVTSLVCLVNSVRIEISNQTNTYVWAVDIYLFAEDDPGPFSMSPNGKVSVDLSVSALDSNSQCDVPPYLHIYVFDSSQYSELTEEYSSPDCYEPGSDDVDRCWYYQPAACKFTIGMNDSLKAASHVRSQDKYYLWIVNPCHINYDIMGSVIMKNDWTVFGHLDLTDRYYPQTVLTSMIIYITIFIIWSWYCYNNVNYFIIHHKLISIILILRILALFAFYICLLVYESNGISTDYDILAYDLIDSLFEVMSVLFLSLVAMGHTLYRPRIQMRQMKVAAFCIFVYGTICFLEEICFLFDDYCHFIRLFQFIVRCFLLVGIVALLNALISSVQAHIKSTNWKNELKNAYLLLHAHKVLRWGFYLYITLPIVVELLNNAIMDWTEEWIVFLINNVLIEPTLLAYIFFYFRPAPYFVYVDGIIPVQ